MKYFKKKHVLTQNETENKFYDLTPLLECGADINIVFGERSNGKTFSFKELAIREFFATGKESAILRRYSEDFRGGLGRQFFDNCINNEISGNLVEKYSGGQYTDIVYQSYGWYFAKTDEKKNIIRSPKPFCYAFSLSSAEHYKSASYPNIDYILFDEMITRDNYLDDEFILFNSVLSTIVRHRGDVKVFLFGNTVNKFSCPYWSEYGLLHVKTMQHDDIDVYKWGESKATIAVEYTGNRGGKASDKYFAFDNPQLQMTTTGEWEFAVHPHKPCKFQKKDIKFIYFIEYDDLLLQCEIVQTEKLYFTFVHLKSTELQSPEKDIIYSLEYNAHPNYRRNFKKPRTPLDHKLFEFYLRDKIFFQDNETGEIFEQYLKYCD